MFDSIIVHGAKEHNLKNLTFEIPKFKLVVITGPSGSGKSSIVFDILQKECLRQYLDSLGMITDHLTKPNVDSIVGLSPSIGVSQRVQNTNPRSTVGSKSGILTCLRILYATIGQRACPQCGQFVKNPIGDTEVRVHDEEKETSAVVGEGKTDTFPCPHCGYSLARLKMAHFSLNQSLGACSTCKGIGQVVKVDESLLLDKDKSILKGGVTFWEEGYGAHNAGIITAASHHYGFSFDISAPLKGYTAEQLSFLLYGVHDEAFKKRYKDIKKPTHRRDGLFEGVITYIMTRYKEKPETFPANLQRYITQAPCSECDGMGLSRFAREVTVAGRNIVDITSCDISGFASWLSDLPGRVSSEELLVVNALLGTLTERTKQIIDVGLEYLSLSRTCPSLSAGESQRLRLAGLLGCGLTGVLYVLDEPTIGLHPHDVEKLLTVLKRLRDLGNSVVVVEHDPEVIKAADYIIDLGPAGGHLGGEIVAFGKLRDILSFSRSLTGSCLLGIDAPSFDFPRPEASQRLLVISNAKAHNLKDITVTIPLNRFVTLTGVSGSGKSTLLFDILDKAARKYFYQASEIPGEHSTITGWQHINGVITVDQSPVGSTKSTRSNVATYTGIFDALRDLFAATPEAKSRDLTASDFSFNTSEERCEHCSGAGQVAVDMHFLDDIQIVCPICHGMRFDQSILDIKVDGYNIVSILDLTVGEALSKFTFSKRLHSRLHFLSQVELDYLKLGQPLVTLSGGEAQRIKLAKELAKKKSGAVLYLLDEPTTGMHQAEIWRLIRILKKLVEAGNSVVVIEHNLDVIGAADEIIDFGPAGGNLGGRIVATGTPQQVMANPNSLTGSCLKKYLDEMSVLRAASLHRPVVLMDDFEEDSIQPKLAENGHSFFVLSAGLPPDPMPPDETSCVGRPKKLSRRTLGTP